eukprot:scaffold401_cov85-Cylindrotheca_fusiformis.AAC.1
MAGVPDFGPFWLSITRSAYECRFEVLVFLLMRMMTTKTAPLLVEEPHRGEKQYIHNWLAEIDVDMLLSESRRTVAAYRQGSSSNDSNLSPGQ